MKTTDLILVGLLGLILWGPAIPAPHPTPGPDTIPAPVVDSWGFRQSVPPTMVNHQAQAVRLAAILREYAEIIDWDGSQPEQRISDTQILAQRISTALNLSFRGDTTATASFIQVWQTAFDREFQPDGQGHELTPEKRQRAVQFFRSLAAGLDDA